MKYVIGFIIIILGMFLVIKSEWMLKIFGYNEWAESKFNVWGGSRTLYKFIGIIIIIAAIFYMTGWLQDILLSIFSPVGNLM